MDQYQEAALWFQKAAEQGNVDSQKILGHFYEEGLGVEQDYQKAFEWYQEAAEQGFEPAKEKLEALRQNKNGVTLQELARKVGIRESE